MRSAATASARPIIPTTPSGCGPQGEAGDELVPVGKAYFGFTDEELLQIDRFVRRNTTEKFGPVRHVVHEPDQGLVLEVAFEGLQRSPRHKSGVAMRFPRINRLRWDKPPRDADRLETLERMLEARPRPVTRTRCGSQAASRSGTLAGDGLGMAAAQQRITHANRAARPRRVRSTLHG